MENDSDYTNKDKRLKFIQSYCDSLKAKVSNSKQNKELLTKFDNSSKNNDIESEFNNYLVKIEYPEFDDNDNLVEVMIRYSILYMEEAVDYNLKLVGLNLVDHLITNISPNKLNLNMRSQLIYDTLFRYLSYKDCGNEFLDKLAKLTCKFLRIIESIHSNNIHQFEKHYKVIDSMLNSCYMSTQVNVKCIYMDNLAQFYLKQLGYFSCRHIERILTVAFDCIENSDSTLKIDIEQNHKLLLSSFCLVESMVEVCKLRMHVHAKRIINHLIKIIYFYSISDQISQQNDKNRLILSKVTNLINTLFQIKRIKSEFYDEFCSLKTNQNLNLTFHYLIKDI